MNNKKVSKTKRGAPPRCDKAFRDGAVKMVSEQGRPSREVAAELGICIDTLRNWLKASSITPGTADRQNRDSKRLRELEAENRTLRKQFTKVRGDRRAKKILRHTFKTIEDKYRYIAADRSGLSVDKLCRLLDLCRSRYYAWTTRGQSRRAVNNQALLREMVGLHRRNPALGLDGLHHLLKRSFICSRGRIHRLMKAHNIHSQRKRAYKAATNSEHSYPVAPNLLKRNFAAGRSNAVWVGDITYLPTDQGWLYLAIVKELCSRKVVGYAFPDRIDAQPTTQALEMAVRREKHMDDLIFHSDRGVQYASHAYRQTLESFSIRQSMSCRGDPYDNAVAENFFCSLKYERIYLRRFSTR